MKPASKFIYSSTDLIDPKVRLKRKLGRLLCPVEREPIFILGNHKSGTSAIAGILAELVGLPTTIDLPSEMECPTFHQVRQGIFSFQDFIQKNKLEFSRKLIKVPELVFLYPELKTFFPKAKFVFIVRDPRANIRSILNRLNIPGQLAAIDRKDFPEITPTWALALDNAWLNLPSDHYIHDLARRWSYIAQVYLQNPEDFVLVRYEDFCRDKLAQLKTLALALNLEPKHDVSVWLDYQFQPRGDQQVNWQNFFGDNLSRIEATCQQEMTLFGYAPQRVTASQP
jgi:hypothetical protein